MFLKKPYPYLGDNKRYVLNNLIIGLFVTLFLIVFQPFEINLWHTDYKTLKLAGFGFVSFVVPTFISLITNTFLPLKLKEEKWTVGHEMLVILSVLLFIALGNLIYSTLIGISDLSFRNYLSALAVTLIVGVFPVTFHVVRKHNKLLKRNLEQSLLMNRELELNNTREKETVQTTEQTNNSTLRFVAENEKDEFKTELSNLLFIESADNYCNVVYLSDGKKKRELIRSSLKRIENQTNHKEVIRCHRAYIVNLANIKSTEGNAAGYKLYFHHTDDCVPVSRAYISIVNERMKALG